MFKAGHMDGETFNSLCEIQAADNPAALGEKGAFNPLCEIRSNQKLITLSPELLERAWAQNGGLGSSFWAPR